MKAIQPEINKATKKYNNKTDNESVLKKQQETTKIQKKYGVSMTGGCLPMLIQLPVFYGLYRVIQNIPAYVSSIYTKYESIVYAMQGATIDTSKLEALGLDSSANYIDVINAIATDNNGKVSTAMSAASNMKDTVVDGKVSVNKVIDVLDKLSSSDLNQLRDMFIYSDDATAKMVASNISDFEHMNNFLFGINIADAPGMKLSIALLVPILSAVLQFVSSKISQASTVNTADPNQQQANKMMNSMTVFMPIMSFFICVSLPVAIGIYWIMGSIIAIISQLIINAYYNKCDMDKVLEKCKEKAAIKAEKQAKRNPNKKSFYEKMIDAQNGNVNTDEKQSGNINKMAGSRLKSYSNPTVDEVEKTSNNTKYKEGSLGSKANIMLQYQNRDNN
jgi:YidC/Oxa1 family membrane protein insertase